MLQMWPKRTHETSVSKTEEPMHSDGKRRWLGRDHQNIEGNLKEDAKFGTSEEEDIPPKEEDNLNESSGEDEEIYLWDELEYKVNYICCISDESTERQVQIASAVVNKLDRKSVV